MAPPNKSAAKSQTKRPNKPGQDKSNIIKIAALIVLGIALVCGLYVVSGNEKPLTCDGNHGGLTSFGSCH